MSFKLETPAQILRNVKDAIRNPYAWPGGYPKYVVMADGEAMSIAAAKDNWRAICRATISSLRDDWAAFGAEINWEDSELICCHTGLKIPSAYAED